MVSEAVKLSMIDEGDQIQIYFYWVQVPVKMAEFPRSNITDILRVS